MISKTSTRLKVYEGVGIGEIQAATNGDVSCWAWMSGQRNTSDWLTRGRTPKKLNKESHWWNGPQQVPNMWARERERELKEAWKKIDRESLQRSSVQNGSTWVFGLPDNPWHQGAVESLMKAAKRVCPCQRFSQSAVRCPI